MREFNESMVRSAKDVNIEEDIEALNVLKTVRNPE